MLIIKEVKVKGLSRSDQDLPNRIIDIAAFLGNHFDYRRDGDAFDLHDFRRIAHIFRSVGNHPLRAVIVSSHTAAVLLRGVYNRFAQSQICPGRAVFQTVRDFVRGDIQRLAAGQRQVQAVGVVGIAVLGNLA